MSDTRSDLARQRRKLLIATSGAGAVAAAATAIPFVASLTPSERARAAGAPVEADVSKLAPGEMMTVEWRGKPVWILRRTAEMLASLETNEQRLADPVSGEPQQPDYAANRHRSINPEFLIVIGICTHLAARRRKVCARHQPGHDRRLAGRFPVPVPRSIFDLAGRVYLSQPAPTNLEIPPYKWLSAGVVVVGEDDQAPPEPRLRLMAVRSIGGCPACLQVPFASRQGDRRGVGHTPGPFPCALPDMHACPDNLSTIPPSVALPAPAAVTPFGARRYNAWNDEVRRRYGGRVQKVSVAAGFTCPNRDGALGTGGLHLLQQRRLHTRLSRSSRQHSHADRHRPALSGPALSGNRALHRLLPELQQHLRRVRAPARRAWAARCRRA